MKKVMLVFGTRPEAIKLCPLVIELRKHQDAFDTVVCVTAQHRQMLDQFLNIFEVIPDYDLDIMKEHQTLFDITSRVLTETNRVLTKEKPDVVIVQGDTTTTFAVSLCAYYNQISVGHVEAGLRTGNKYSPFPEEVNRKLTGAIADLHFAPTKWAKNNLLAENIPEEKIVVTGNTVIDALLTVRQKIQTNHKDYGTLFSGIDLGKRIILVTGHRRENFGQAFVNFCIALKTLACKYPDIEIVYPVHFNPNVRRPVNDILKDVVNIKLIEPLDYEPFIYLLDKCYFIITDSGGIQEEAPSLGKPVLVTRDTTERPEAVGAGSAKLVGTDKDIIILEAERLLNDSKHYSKMSNVQNPFGDGNACERIIEGLFRFFRET